MKKLRLLLALAVGLAAIVGFGKFFVSQLSTGSMRPDEPPAVLFAAPEGFSVESLGDRSRAEAASRLGALLDQSDPGAKFGLHFQAKGTDLYWLVERVSPADTVLTELAAAPSGTRVSTTWSDSVDQLHRRLAWAASHEGEMDNPELPEGRSENLYH